MDDGMVRCERSHGGKDGGARCARKKTRRERTERWEGKRGEGGHVGGRIEKTERGEDRANGTEKKKKKKMMMKTYHKKRETNGGDGTTSWEESDAVDGDKGGKGSNLEPDGLLRLSRRERARRREKGDNEGTF